MPSQTQIRHQISNQIVAALQKGVIPWRKPWSPLQNTGYPMNAVSGRLYQGINRLLLELSAQKRGFSSRFWATYRQWASLGGQVQKRPDEVPPGKWGTKIILWKPITTLRKNGDGEEKETTFALLRQYVVFNAEQTEGADQFRVHEPIGQAVIDYGPAEQMIAATGADIRHTAGDRAAYFRPPADYIQLPLKSQFGSPATYYGTLFHELSHWSEHRLDWTGSYALGELRAELGAAFLTAAVGIPQDNSLENAAAYLDSWIGAMKADHRVIFQISSAASKASDFILSFSRAQQPEQPEEMAA